MQCIACARLTPQFRKRFKATLSIFSMKIQTAQCNSQFASTDRLKINYFSNKVGVSTSADFCAAQLHPTKVHRRTIRPSILHAGISRISYDTLHTALSADFGATIGYDNNNNNNYNGNGASARLMEPVIDHVRICASVAFHPSIADDKGHFCYLVSILAYNIALHVYVWTYIIVKCVRARVQCKWPDKTFSAEFIHTHTHTCIFTIIFTAATGPIASGDENSSNWVCICVYVCGFNPMNALTGLTRIAFGDLFDDGLWKKGFSTRVLWKTPSHGD